MKNKLNALFWLFLSFILIYTPDVLALASRPNPDPNAPPPPAWASWMPVFVIIFVFYFLIIRPQNKQRKEKQNLLNDLKKGDKVVTQGGLFATIVNVGPHYFDIKINEDTKVKIQKSSVVDIVKETPQKAITPEVVSPK